MMLAGLARKLRLPTGLASVCALVAVVAFIVVAGGGR